MDIVDLIDQSAAAAVERAIELHGRLCSQAADRATVECRDEIRQLVEDIVSLRNATELLKRQVRAEQRDAA